MVLKHFNIVKLIVILTWFFSEIDLKRKNNLNLVIKTILRINAITELFGFIFKIYFLSTKYLITTNVVMTFLLWFQILQDVYKKKIVLYSTIFFLFFFFFDFIILNHCNKFSYYSFVFGSLIYVCCYLFFNFSFLKEEKIAFFFQNQFIIVSAPIFFFLGMSFLFAFVSPEISGYKIYEGKTLYSFINDFVNFVQYILIAYFIYLDANKHE